MAEHPMEPFRIKAVEAIPVTTREQRERYIKEASYNPFLIRSEQVTVDLLSDSGSGAMSDRQWAALMIGDEAYASRRNFFSLQKAVFEVTGLPYVVPAHQGRGAENVLCSVLVKKGDCVVANQFFDTTRAHVENAGGECVELVCDEAFDLADKTAPFKGNLDVKKLDSFLKKNAKKTDFVLLTVTNNTGGGQPVSLENIRATAEVCKRYGRMLLFDAARFAENAYFIKTREKGCEKKSIPEIVREMFSYVDGCVMSAKKDGLVNMGGFVAVRDAKLAEMLKVKQILFEGFSTYGGLTGRDLEALSVGLREVLNVNYLAYRTGQVAYLGKKLKEVGIPVLEPFGGHAVYVDARKFLPHLKPDAFPGWALSCELYLEGGVRSCEIGNVMFGKKVGKKMEWPKMDLVRLAIPRRVYTQSHMDYVVAAFERLAKKKKEIRGMRITYEAPVLRHFSLRMEPL